jgi:hypothetical protein
MSRTPPRFLPTVALAALWLALYFLWLAVRPESVVVVTRQSGRPAAATTTTVPPVFKLKP